MAEKLHVDLGSRGYDIIVGERLLADAGAYLKPLVKKSAIIVSDENVARFHLHRLTSALEDAGIRHRTVIVKPGEATKSLDAFANLLETLLEQTPDRNTTLIALGGGVVGDLTGFAASVLLRGVEFIQIPTTLLAQVDSSVGGKTGINSKFGKNLIGSFHQPLLVLADVETLSTLPPRELKSGYAETLKYGLIRDEKFFAWFEKNGEKLLAETAPSLALPRDAGEGTRKSSLPRSGGELERGALLTHAIVESCKAKAAIVAADEKEHGQRALLNFGHTFAHALEAETGYGDKLLHGEAVAIGMVLAFQTSVKMGLCKQSELDRVVAHYKEVGLPASPLEIMKSWNIDKLMEHFTHDKKTKDGALTFILARKIGDAFIADDVDKNIIRQTLAEACNVR